MGQEAPNGLRKGGARIDVQLKTYFGCCVENRHREASQKGILIIQVKDDSVLAMDVVRNKLQRILKAETMEVKDDAMNFSPSG